MIIMLFCHNHEGVFGHNNAYSSRSLDFPMHCISKSINFWRIARIRWSLEGIPNDESRIDVLSCHTRLDRGKRIRRKIFRLACLPHSLVTLTSLNYLMRWHKFCAIEPGTVEPSHLISYWYPSKLIHTSCLWAYYWVNFEINNLGTCKKRTLEFYLITYFCSFRAFHCKVNLHDL